MCRRAARVSVLMALLWLTWAWAATEPELSPRVFDDCYPRATWDGRNFIPTGEWRCL